MLRKLNGALEHPLHPLLGPNLRSLKFTGLWQPETKLSNYFYDFLSILCILFVGTQYVQLYSVFGDLHLVMDNLSITTISTMSIVKLATFRLWHRHWSELILAVSAIELSQMQNPRPEDRMITKSYFLHARVVTYFFWTVSGLTISMIILNPVLMYASSSLLRDQLRNETAGYPQIFSSWLPFDTSRPPNYLVTVVLHTMMGYYGAGTIAVWDTFVVTLMVFFGGQLQLLRNECFRITGATDEGPVDNEEAHRRIVHCHRHHVFLLKYSKLFNSMISPVMFVYFIICSVMLSAIAIQVTTQMSSALELFWTLEFLLATLIQLFMFYWHSNEVLFKSMAAERGAYEAAWVGRGARMSREVALLATGLRLPVVFSAGPFNKMSIATFIAILKAAYSYFTLLRARQQP